MGWGVSHVLTFSRPFQILGRSLIVSSGPVRTDCGRQALPPVGVAMVGWSTSIRKVTKCDVADSPKREMRMCSCKKEWRARLGG